MGGLYATLSALRQSAESYAGGVRQGAAMRSFYEMETPSAAPQPGSDRAVRLFLQLAVLAFWTPCAAIDLYLLWKGWGGASTGEFVFGVLFRQALVFLALWFTVSIAHGLMVGRRTPKEAKPRRRRRGADAPVRTAQSAGVTLSRHTRGI
jgi:hypothetical protein